MKMKLTVIALIYLNTLLHLIHAQWNDNPKCGTPYPENEQQCTKYGTDSGFLCCYFSAKNITRPVCSLMSYGKAKDLGIKGQATISDVFISCGNQGQFLKMSCIISLMLILLVLF